MRKWSRFHLRHRDTNEHILASLDIIPPCLVQSMLQEQQHSLLSAFAQDVQQPKNEAVHTKMSNIVAPIIEEIDHSFLCDRSDALCREFLESSKLKAVFVDFPTTAENIAAWMFEKLSDEFVVFKNIHELRVVVQETERTSAEVSGLIRVNVTNVKVLEHQGHMLE